MALLGVNKRAAPLGTFRPPPSDIDLQSLRLYVPRGVQRDLRTLTSSVELQQTIEGASTVTLKVRDWHRGLLRSALLQTKARLVLDNIEYTLVKVSHADNEIGLIFEESAVNLLRGYDTPKKANRANTTRAQFIRGMVNEVTERRIPFECPELNQRQPIAVE